MREMYKSEEIDYLKYLKNKKIYIFGCGAYGKQVFNRLNGFEVLAFVDNDKQKQGTEVLGTPVISFEKYCEEQDEESIIILAVSAAGEVKGQLMDKNIFRFVSFSQIDFGGGEEYYDENYFAFQKPLGEFGAKIKRKMFAPYIKKDMTVLEFGSGGGYLLKEMEAKEKLGIEINDMAREEAVRQGIRSVKRIEDVPDAYADIIISTSVLEHVEEPLTTLRKLRDKLKDGGKIVFHVPNESCEKEYIRSEVNNHLYTWNCLNLGNLFKAAGYFVCSVERIQEIWPDHFYQVKDEISDELFEDLCKINGIAQDENRCIIVACK